MAQPTHPSLAKPGDWRPAWLRSTHSPNSPPTRPRLYHSLPQHTLPHPRPQTHPPHPRTLPLPGCLHPRHRGYFSTPAEYMAWYDKYGPVRDPAAPTVAVLLYRKHVITDQVGLGDFFV